MNTDGDLLHTVTTDNISDSRKASWQVDGLGLGITLCYAGATADHYQAERIGIGFETWRPILYAYMLWATALCVAQVIVNGEKGKRTLFVLPAALFVVSLVVFPLLFALYISFTDWNLASPNGPQPNGWDNLVQMWNDSFYWNALTNMVYYVLAVSAGIRYCIWLSAPAERPNPGA